ncbi:MAG: BamA/TamA family outer membrane protein [Meiothermus sp.]|uniref:BamA/OMP85 family outer membrane protein n=1 Tax=Meiothermus sp. TaxID=1955249 RepID=UPI0028CC73D8|nr:BamA/TamA family outer membrane protein [Meiothermus sp.]MDT7920162.1 BamA/TamA family outer membrane protein [Meiothermus sp.]
MKRLLSLVVLLGAALAAPIQEVEVQGADAVLAALVRISLPFGVGDEPGDLEQARAAVLNTGYFRDARVRLDGSKLVVEVTTNPTISKVATSARAFPEASVLRYLETEQAVGVGSVFNPKKATEAALALARIYRNEGFPFEPRVIPETKEVAGGVELFFNIEESPELKSVEVGGATYVPKERLEPLFQPVIENGRFSFERFRDAVGRTADVYASAGFRGSGVDLTRTSLVDGVLKVAFSELKIVEISARGVDISALGLKVGDPFNLDQILDGVNALSRSISRVVEFRPERVSQEGVRLVFQAGEQRFGAIREVRIEGNTAIASDKLLEKLRLKPGDEYNPALANEDFARILREYRDAGYDLVAQPEITFREGVYVQRLRELRIAGYRIEPALTRTDPSVYLREMPPVGSLFSVSALRQGITNILRTGLLREPPGIRPEQGDKPEDVILVLSFREAQTGSFIPGISWSSLTGWEGNISISDTNLWGLAHQYSVTLGINPNDAGQLISFNASYRIPWVYIDFADFKQVRTSFGISVYSQPQANINFPLEQLYNGNTPDLNGDGVIDDKDRTSLWQYTERKTGINFSISRPLSSDLPNLRISAGLGWEWNIPVLEVNDPNRPRCLVKVPDSSNKANPPVAEDTACSDALLQDAQNKFEQNVREFQALTLTLGTTYTTLNNPNFPTQGFSLNLNTGYGITFPKGSNATQYVPVVVTGRTYFQLDQAARQALGLRLSFGTILGTAQDSQKFSLGGNSTDITTLRGYDPRFLDKGTAVLNGSIEYGYDFGLSPAGGTNLYGFLFADVGRLWPASGDLDAFFLGVGFGVQVNLDLLGAVLPPIRLDYGFSQRNPAGRFALRLGLGF